MKLRQLLELILLGTLIGPSFLFIKLGVDEMSPFSLTASRVALAGLVLLLILKLKGRRLPHQKKTWKHLTVAGFFSCGLPFTLFAIGEMRVTSALAGVINGFTPIAAALLAHYTLAQERLNLSRSLGVGLGVAGFSLLLFPELFKASIQGDTLGVVLIGIASCSYAVGMVYNRKFLSSLQPLVAPTGSLLIATCYLIPFAFIMEPFFETEPITLKGVASVLELGLIGTCAFFALYYRLLRQTGASVVAMSNYLLPVYSLAFGMIFLGETVSWTAYIAGGLILIGMMFVNGTLKLPQRRPSQQEEAVPIYVDDETDFPDE